jgi:SAM-dependent methyltransferase
MEWFIENFLGGLSELRVLDIGSYDYNGSYKSLFKGAKGYVGMDLQGGPNVDVVPLNPYQWDEFDTDSFDVIVSGQTFEHTEFFWITFSEIVRCLRPGGWPAS